MGEAIYECVCAYECMNIIYIKAKCMNARMCMNAGVYKSVCAYECMDVGMYERRDVGMCECIKCTDA